MAKESIKVSTVQVQPGGEIVLDPGKEPLGIATIRDQIFLVVLERDDHPNPPPPLPTAEIPQAGAPIVEANPGEWRNLE